MKINIYRSRDLNKVIKFLFYGVILLMPYDAIKFMPSNYRPLSIIPLFFLFICLIPKISIEKKNKTQRSFLWFYLISNIISIFMALFYGTSFSFYLDYFLTSTIGAVLYFTMSYVIRYSKFKYSKGVFISTLIAKAYVLPIIITLFDFLSIYGLIPYNISLIIHKIFGGGQSSRVCGFTLEASWLSMHMLIAMIAFYFVYKRTSSCIYITLMLTSIFIFLLTFSMQGYVYLILFLLILFILKYISEKKKFKIKDFLILVFGLSFVFIFISVIQSIDSDLYFIERFKNLNIFKLITKESSAFIRIINPVIGIIMGVLKLPFGVGAGNYPVYYEEFVERFFPFALDIYGGNNEIVTTIENLSANCKCLYTRLVGETGIISILFFVFVINSIRASFKTDKKLFMLTLLVCIFMLQFDSMCYFPFYIILSFSSEYIKRRKTNDINYIS